MSTLTLTRLFAGWFFVLAFAVAAVAAAKSAELLPTLSLMVGFVAGWGLQECLKPDTEIGGT